MQPLNLVYTSMYGNIKFWLLVIAVAVYLGIYVW